MPERSNVIYHYDGSFDGLLCCVFECYAKNEIPLEILSPEIARTTLFSGKEIITDPHKARRVLVSIPKRMGHDALNFVRNAYLTCLAQKELYILRFLRLGYRHGPSVMEMLTDEVVNTLFKAVNHLKKESHLLKGFLRFSVFENVLLGQIEPKNQVLPLLAKHFCQRYQKERFFIYDKTHSMALVYKPYQFSIIRMESLLLSEADEEEKFFRELWRLFYDTIEVEGRHNPRCRMSHMPKRYWKHMTEFGDPDSRDGTKDFSSKKLKFRGSI